MGKARPLEKICLDSSKAGKRREVKEAISIIPALYDNPSSKDFCEKFFLKKIGKAPAPVAKPAIKVPINAVCEIIIPPY